VDLLVRSFEWLPISTTPLSSGGWIFVVRYASIIFAAGLLLALPMLAALLVTNIAMGILTRAAPQLNLFAIGFPISMGMGFLVLMLSMNYLGPVVQSFFERGFDAIDAMLRALG
jgi:flagellar biosynthesis protein FliR